MYRTVVREMCNVICCVARYTFGEPVRGMVTLNFTMEASTRSYSLMFKQVVASLDVSNNTEQLKYFLEYCVLYRKKENTHLQ